MVKWASVFLLDSAYYLHPMSQTTTGLLIKTDPEEIVEDINDNNKVRTALLRMFDHSFHDLEHPKVWPDIEKEFWKLGGIKSWQEFNQNAKYVDVEYNGEEVIFTPYRDKGLRGGFEPIKDKSVKVLLTEDARVSHFLSIAFELCE